MSSKYLSTLGYTPNPLIEKYNEQFIKKLHLLWKKHFQQELPWDDFFLFPDIHGLLLAMDRPWITEYDEYKNILLREYWLQNTSTSILVPDTWRFIPGTNIELTLRFYNPDAEKHSHPEHKKNHVGITFWDKNETEWRELFAKAFDIVKRVSPEFMSEIERVIKKVVPFDVSYKVHNSGSYSDVIGQLLMSYPTGMGEPELALLEAILHEYNHNKLNLILQTHDLVLNDRQEIYYSPYRPDARHIHGIYLGLHALTGAFWVLWNAHVQWIFELPLNWQEKATAYVLKNGLSLQVLDKYALLSPLGKELLEEMRMVHKECLFFIKKAQISEETIWYAKQAITWHFRDVQKNYPYVRA
jgi:hypothetical protein